MEEKREKSEVALGERTRCGEPRVFAAGGGRVARSRERCLAHPLVRFRQESFISHLDLSTSSSLSHTEWDALERTSGPLSILWIDCRDQSGHATGFLQGSRRNRSPVSPFGGLRHLCVV